MVKNFRQTSEFFWIEKNLKELGGVGRCLFRYSQRVQTLKPGHLFHGDPHIFWPSFSPLIAYRGIRFQQNPFQGSSLDGLLMRRTVDQSRSGGNQGAR